MVKLKKYKFLYIFSFCLVHFSCYAQFYSQGENPSSVKWSQINTENFQVIFDENAKENALKVANVLDRIYEYGYANLEKKPEKISIVLQSHMTVSNGFVTLAPRRSEFYTTAPQDNDVIDWLGLLTIHEYRHVVQIDKLNQGLTKLAYLLLGEQGRGFLFGLTTPLWFMEGDAVGMETALTHAGRGRLPSFEMGLRTQVLTEGYYTYHKASFGSYKDIVPSQYPFGYFMTTYVKNHYGRAIWSKILNRIGKNPLVPFRFSTALKKEIGMGTGKLYKKMIQEMDSLWTKQGDVLTYTESKTINLRKNTIPLNYRFPKSNQKNVIYAVKKGFSEITKFVQLDTLGNEKIIYQPINYNEASFFSNGKQLVWTETSPDIRWEYRNFSEVKILDLKTQKVNTFLKKTKLFYPTLNPSGISLTAVNFDEFGLGKLVVYDIKSKNISFEWNVKVGEEVKNPSWLSDTEIVFIHYTPQGNALKSINIKSRELTTYIEHQYIQMRNPITTNTHIYFEASFSGIQNIYVVDLNTKNAFQVTSSKYGAFDPSIFENELYYSDYTSVGYDVVRNTIDTEKWIPLEDIQNQSVQYYQEMVKQEGNVNLLDSISTNEYEISRYHKWKHLINLHSWQPFSLNENDGYKPLQGIELKSQNKLSSTILHYRYQNIRTENLKKHELDIIYNAFFPKLMITPYYHKYTNIETSSGLLIHELNDRGLKLNTNIPFRFVSNHLCHSYIPFIQSRWVNRSFQLEDRDETVNYIPLEVGTAIIITTPRAKRDIVSKWELQSTVLYGYTLDNALNEEGLFFRLQGNIPSLFQHHVLSVAWEYQNATEENLILSNRIRLPRGNQSVLRVGDAQSLFINYIFPIAYPDTEFGFLAYFQRIKANLFFDYVQAKEIEALYSYGTEITFDLNALRYSYLLDVGVRVSRVQNQQMMYEPMINVSF